MDALHLARPSAVAGACSSSLNIPATALSEGKYDAYTDSQVSKQTLARMERTAAIG
ncbi:MAG: hypothetical protein NZ553_14195 [Caldilinea sp.]|nr:hypothetical protein [Caldilinea sp.]MDW8441623.1 hypothetical protein [Caldilineaceae bacterium]